MNPLELPWWMYLSVVFSFFGICMGLNYLVKKINEAKIEERLLRMLQKASTTQSTQVTGPLIAVETSGAGRLNHLKTMQEHSPPGISLVFNREENKRRSDPYSLVKPLIPRLSVENINVNSPTERTVHAAPMKKIESAQIVAKANSSQILSEKVVVKTSEYGNQSIKKTSSTSKSDCYVTKLITVKMNEYGNVPELGPYSVARKRNITSKVDPEIEGIPIVESTTSIHVQDESAIEAVARNESGSKAEETTQKETIDVTEKVLYEKNIYTSRIIRTKTSILDITVEKQDVNDSKTNEEVNTGCSIKKSVESIISKIASNLKIKNEDPKIDKNASDSITAAKQSSSNTGSGRKVTEINSTENKEPKCNADKEHSYPAEIDNVGEGFPFKKIESDYIKRASSDSKSSRLEEHIESEHTVAKKSSSYSRIGRLDENISNKNFESEHIGAKKSTSSHTFERVGENRSLRKVESSNTPMKQIASIHSQEFPLEENIRDRKVESGHTAIKQTASAYSQDAHVGEIIPVEKVESGRFDNKETTSVYALECVGENFPVRKVKSSYTAIEQTTPAHAQNACVDENISIEKVESNHFAAKNPTSIHSFERAGESIPVEIVEFGYTAARPTTSAHSLNECGENNISVKKVKSGHVATKETASVDSFDLIGKHIPNEPEHVVAKDTDSIRTFELIGENTLNESGLIGVKETATSHSNDNNVGENIQVRTVESDHIAAKEAILYAANAAKKDLVSVKKSVTLIESRRSDSEKPLSILRTAKASPFRIHSGITLRKQVKKQNIEPIGTKEALKTQVDDNKAESSVLKMRKAVHDADKTKYSNEFHFLANKKDDNETANSAVISGISRTTDDPEEEEEPSKSLADKIIELLEDENIVDIKLRKPSPNSKK